MTPKEAYEHLSDAWGCAEDRFEVIVTGLDECLKHLGVTEQTISQIKAQQEAERQAAFLVELKKGEELCRAGVYIRADPYAVNDEFFNRDPVEFRRRRDEIIEKYRTRRQ